MSQPMYASAQAYLHGGLSFFPTHDKQPIYHLLPKVDGRPSWLPFQNRQPTIDEIRDWYHQRHAGELALVCGPGSHGNNPHHPHSGAFIYDIDRPELLTAFYTKARPYLRDVTIERTRRGGAHLGMLCDEAETLRNQKLALRINPQHVSRASTPDEPKFLCDIETRGNGGYACIWPTPNYTLEQGSYADLKWVDMDAIVYPLLQIGMEFNTATAIVPSLPAARTVAAHSPDQLSAAKLVIAQWRDKYGASDMLIAYGYRLKAPRRFVRPGGVKGSVIVSEDNGICISFNTNDPLNQYPNAVGRHFHDSFSIFTVIEHDGDMHAALCAAATQLGMSYPDHTYSDRRASIHTPDLDAVQFFAGQIGNQVVFVVDDMLSAMTLQAEGCAALYVPPGTRSLDGWKVRLFDFSDRYVWTVSESDRLALDVSARIVDGDTTAADMLTRAASSGHDATVAFINRVRAARMPHSTSSARGK